MRKQNNCLFIDREFGADILAYDITNDDWDIMKNVKITLFNCDCIVVTNDERYLIILNSFKSESIELVDVVDDPVYEIAIQIIDFENKSSGISIIKLPASWKTEWMYAFLMNGCAKTDVIINGFVRQCWKQEISEELPSELISIIAEFYSDEFIHIMQQDNGNQWAISLEKLLCDTNFSIEFK